MTHVRVLKPSFMIPFASRSAASSWHADLSIEGVTAWGVAPFAVQCDGDRSRCRSNVMRIVMSVGCQPRAQWLRTAHGHASTTAASSQPLPCCAGFVRSNTKPADHTRWRQRHTYDAVHSDNGAVHSGDADERNEWHSPHLLSEVVKRLPVLLLPLRLARFSRCSSWGAVGCDASHHGPPVAPTTTGSSTWYAWRCHDRMFVNVKEGANTT
jgi:hypothetical protein